MVPGCFNGFDLRLLGGWVYRFSLMGLIFFFFSHGFDFCSHGFVSYGFGFIVLIFSVDGFAGFQEDES